MPWHLMQPGVQWSPQDHRDKLQHTGMEQLGRSSSGSHRWISSLVFFLVMAIFFIVLVMLFIILVIMILVVMVVMVMMAMVSKAPMRTRCLKYVNMESKFWTLYVVSMMRYYFRCRQTPTRGSFSRYVPNIWLWSAMVAALASGLVLNRCRFL